MSTSGFARAIRRRLRKVDATRVALVTTVRDPGPSFASFLRYHTSIGIDELFVFFDDPDDPWAALSESNDNVRVTRCDARTRELWRRMPSYQASRSFIDREVMARQTLNAELAIRMALEADIDWLIHIDSDELFYCPDIDVHDHFASLSRRGRRKMRYLNHEAIPETTDVSDCFDEVSLFRVNPGTRRRTRPTEEQTKALMPVSQMSPETFLFYMNGKSAARPVDGLTSNGPHEFVLPEGVDAVDRSTKTFLPRATDRLRRTRPLRRWVAEEPAVLHYACCGFEAFWSKYQLLGPFPDTWYGMYDIASNGGRFHLKCRDVVMSGDVEKARRFYEDRFVLRDPEVIERLVQLDLIRRISSPISILERERASG